MTVEKVICDECGRVKAEANHWHKMGVYRQASRDGERITVELGVLGGANRDATWRFSVKDLCGQECFHKHLAKLLGFNPENGAVSAEKTTAEAKA